MRKHPSLKSWVGTVTRKMPHLSKPQAKVLAISVLYRGCAIPVAWKIVKATSKGAWKPYWLELFTYIQGSVPSDWMVIVTADRGLYANWLYYKIVQLGWHPYLRINTGGFFQSELNQKWKALSEVVTEKGHSWCGRVRCFKKHSIDCTLMACWERDYAQPWLIVTDLAPQEAEQGWYAMRSWIECSFKDVKRGGFSWHQTKTTDPVRAERQWLAIAVAMLWLISVGGEDEVSHCHQNQPEHLESASGSATCSSTSPPRKLSCFRRGFLSILVTLLWGQTLPMGHFYSFPWTDSFSLSSA